MEHFDYPAKIFCYLKSALKPQSQPPTTEKSSECLKHLQELWAFLLNIMRSSTEHWRKFAPHK